MLRKIEVERFSVTSLQPFEKVLPAISEAVGHPDTAEFWKSTHAAESVAELVRALKPVLGRTGLMQFVAFDHGAIIRKGTGCDAPRNVRLLIGNPLINNLRKADARNIIGTSRTSTGRRRAFRIRLAA